MSRRYAQQVRFGAEGGIVLRGIAQVIDDWAIPFSSALVAQLASQLPLLLVSPFLLSLPLFLTPE